MNADLCRFSLAITPDWSYFLIPFGALVFALGILRVYLSQSGGSFEFPGKVTLENFNPMLLFTVGVFVLIVGVGALVAHEDQTFARWVGEKLPILIAEADKQVNADLYAKPLGELVSGASPKSLYKFEVSPDAAKVPITGDFEDALCDADLCFRFATSFRGNSSAAQTRRPEPFASARKRIQNRARLSSVGRVLMTGGKARHHPA